MANTENTTLELNSKANDYLWGGNLNRQNNNLYKLQGFDCVEIIGATKIYPTASLQVPL